MSDLGNFCCCVPLGDGLVSDSVYLIMVLLSIFGNMAVRCCSPFPVGLSWSVHQWFDIPQRLTAPNDDSTVPALCPAANRSFRRQGCFRKNFSGHVVLEIRREKAMKHDCRFKTRRRRKGLGKVRFLL